jgi:hypothetical protein
MNGPTLLLLGVLLGLLAFSTVPLILLPAYLWRVHRARNGRFSVLLLLYAGYFFLPSVPNCLLTLSEIGDVAASSTDVQWFGEFLFEYFVLYVGFWFFWLLAALATVMLGYWVARPSGAVRG